MESKSKISRKASTYWCLTLLIPFFCLRGFIGYDWLGYYPVFENVDDLFHFSSKSFTVAIVGAGDVDLVEPGFIIYASFIKTFFDSWEVFVFITTLIPIVAITIFIKHYSSNIALSYTLFYSLYSVILIDLMRNGLAISVFLFLLVYRENIKIIPLLLWCLIGISFHRSFLILIPFLFIKTYLPSMRIVWMLFIVVNVLFLLQIPLLKIFLALLDPLLSNGNASAIIENYSNKDEFSSARGITIGYFIRVFVFLVISVYSSKLYKEKTLTGLINAYFCYVFISIGMSDMRVFVDRMEFVFFFPFVILYPYLLNIMKPCPRLIFAMFLFMFCSLKVYQGHNTIMSEYYTMFSGKKFEDEYNLKHSIAYQIVEESK